MSSDGLDSFRSAGGGGWSSLGVPHYAKLTPSKSSGQSHGVFHNLLTDLGDSATGIFTGTALTAKNLFKAVEGHPEGLKAEGKSFVDSYRQMYGPAFHGNFGLTLHRMGQHPLQPLLDAISVVTLPAGALGVGIKAGDVAAQAGERLGLVSAERAAQLTRAADYFRVQQPSLIGRMEGGAPLKPVHWDANPARRQFQALHRGTQQLLAKNVPSLFGEGGKIFDLTPGGQQDRFLARTRSSRASATATQMGRELHAARSLFTTNMGSKDIADALAPHIDKVIEDHAFRMPEYALIKAGKEGDKLKLADGWAFLGNNRKYAEYPAANTTEEFGKWISNFMQRRLTKNHKKAMQDANGNYLVVRTKSLEDIKNEAVNTHRTIKAVYTTPTKVWKWMVLATAPRYFVNNVVGNSMMTAMAANPISTTRAMYHTIRQMHGTKAANKALDAVGKAQREITGDALDKWYLAETQGFGADVTRDMTLDKKFKNPVIRGAVDKAQGGLFSVTHHVSDTIPRRTLFNLFLRQHPEYIANFRAARKLGWKSSVAHDYAIDKASENPIVRDWATEKVNNVLGQYHHFNGLEKAIKQVVPFYSWDRAIVRHAFHLATDRPAQAAALYQLGHYGTNETQKVLGHVPDFMKGFLPLSAMGIGEKALASNGLLDVILGGQHQGRTRVLSTQGLNPYSTLPDVAKFVATGVEGDPQAGESLATQINPFLEGAIEHYTGQSLLSGKKLPQHGGLIQDTLNNVAGTTPLATILKPIIEGRPHPKVNAQTGKASNPLLYRGDERQAVLSALGAPVKEVNLASAKSLYRQEHGIKTVHLPNAHLKTDGLSSFHKLVTEAVSKSKAPKPHKPRKPSLRKGRPAGIRKPRIGTHHAVSGIKGV